MEDDHEEEEESNIFEDYGDDMEIIQQDELVILIFSNKIFTDFFTIVIYVQIILKDLLNK